MHTPKPLHQQTIVITGASSGIGLITARLAAERGANVVASSRNLDDLRKFANEMNSSGARVLPVEADVTKIEDLEKLKTLALKRFGAIDTWVNNAGTSIYASLLDCPVDDERKLFDTNFWGLRIGCHVAFNALKEKGGVIINIGSEVSGRAIPQQGMYSATKHAVKAFTDAFRMELEKAEWPVHVSLIRPTAINTPFAEHAKNLLHEGEPSLPSPTYHPKVVAEAILNCAVNPQRDVYVGGASRLFDVLDTFFPRAVDYLMETMLFKQQSRGTKLPHTEEQEALHHAPASEGKELGATIGRMRGTSLYTSAAQHPLRTLLLLGGVAALLGVTVKKAMDEQKAA